MKTGVEASGMENWLHDWHIGVNWIYAIVIFTTWRNAITKTRLGDMPLQLFHTSIYVIIVITKSYMANYTSIHTLILHMDR
jgi:hypothetical protein